MFPNYGNDVEMPYIFLWLDPEAGRNDTSNFAINARQFIEQPFRMNTNEFLCISPADFFGQYMSEEIFEEWSVTDADAQTFTNENPTVYKTLNLTKIISILNAVANDSFEATLIASVALDFRVKK